MSLLHAARKRHSTKAFDPSRKIPETIIAELRELLRLAPSSVNSQPWHFVLASTDAAKARIGKAAEAGYPYNLPKILNASHVLVLCARTAISETHLEALLEKEQADGRFVNDEARAGQWCEKQLKFDPDLWIVEIEDRQGRAFVDEEIV